MSDVKFPDIVVPLTGTDGNIFSLLGKVRRALIDAGVPKEEISQFAHEVFGSSSYEAAIGVIVRWVNVV